MTDAALEDLAASLVAVDSTNPSLIAGGAGEAAVAQVVADWMRGHGLEVSVREIEAGAADGCGRRPQARRRPFAAARGSSHTVGPGAMAEPHPPRVHEGRLVGRGAYDIKGGIAAAMAAAAAVEGLRGDVIVAAVPDEEAGGIGTRALLESDWRPDAAVVTQPTDLAPISRSTRSCAWDECSSNWRALPSIAGLTATRAARHQFAARIHDRRRRRVLHVSKPLCRPKRVPDSPQRRRRADAG